MLRRALDPHAGPRCAYFGTDSAYRGELRSRELRPSGPGEAGSGEGATNPSGDACDQVAAGEER